jgi:AraC-like DNA-binding protein
MVYVVGIGLAFFLALVLFTKRGRTGSDTTLAVWLLLIGLHLLLYYTNYLHGSLTLSAVVAIKASRGLPAVGYPYPHLLGLERPLPLLQGPMLYLYTRTLLGRLARRWGWHFAVPALVYAYLMPFLALPASQKIWVYAHQGEGYERFNAVLLVLIFGSGVGYVGATYRLLRQHRRATRTLSDQDPAKRGWPWVPFWGMAAIWSLVLLQIGDSSIYLAVVLFVLWLGYSGIRYGKITTLAPVPPLADKPDTPSAAGEPLAANGLTPTPNGKKYARSGLTSEAAAALHGQLTELMTGQQLYRDSELTLTDLAQRLGVHPNYLSQVINEREAMSFTDYVSSLRVEAFKQLAADPKNSHLTLLALAYECGFNSKSTFNRQFKKLTGQLPSDYWQQAAGDE